MKKGYSYQQFLSLLFLFVGTCSFAQQTTAYQLNHQELDVDAVKADRYLFDMTVSESIISLNGLRPGDHYELLINPFNIESDCAYQIDAYSLDGSVAAVVQDTNEGGLNQFISFRATSSSEMFHVSNNGCTPARADQAVLSLLNLSCIASSDEDRNPANMSDLSRMAVLSVDFNYSVTQLIEEVFIGGGCFDVTNVQLIGNAAGVGHFSAGSTSIGLEDGVILASGDITNAPGPNNSGGAGSSLPGADGDPDLALLGAGTIFDACGIEFDFTPTVDLINFQYAFGSEEYCEYVGSTFNDVFGFFISGPGIGGPFTNGAENIAIVPGAGSYVAINTVNHNLNTAYFNGNANNCNGVITNPTDIQYDGYTTVLTATANVIPCETYHIRMVVSDVGDQILDSGVFLGANSFNAGGTAEVQVDIPGYVEGEAVYEGCSNGFLIFERDADSDLSLDFVISYEFDPASTALDGVDYSSIPNPVTIPAGLTSVSIPFEVYEDFVTEGTESIILILSNACSCEGASVEILINDVDPMVSITEDLVFCNEAFATIGPDVAGGVPDYNYFWSNGAQSPTINISQTFDQTYYITITDVCNNSIDDTINVIVIPEPTAEIAGSVVICGENPSGFVDVTFTGDGPWEFLYYVDGTVYGPVVTSENPYQLPIDQVGTYELASVTSGSIAGVCEGTVSGFATVEDTFIELLEVTYDPTCANAMDGVISVAAVGGIEPYSYFWDNGEETETIAGLAGGTYTVFVSDLNGCTQENTYTIVEPPLIDLSAVATTEVNCANPNGGNIDLTVSGGMPGYIYEWDNGETTQDLNGFPAGTYTVTVTDLNSCTEETVGVITGNTAEPTASANGGVLNCAATEINLTGSGSSANGAPVSYQWLDGAGAPISTTGDVLVNTVGSYLFVVTDDTNGCTTEVAVEVTQAIELPTPDATIDGMITCNQGMVTIDGSGSSGSGAITYQWLDGSGSPVGNGPTIDVTNPGGYTLVVTDDANGCTNQLAVDVPENIVLPTPQIDPPEVLDCNIITTSITGSGSSASGGSTTLAWFDSSGGPLGGGTEISVNAPGTFVLVVTDDANGCTNEQAVTVTQDLVPPPVDANVDGLLTCAETFVTLSTGAGGNGNQFEWFGPSGAPLGSASDIIVTEIGTYSILVTGTGNGCTAEMMIPVSENITLPVADAGAAATLTCASEFATLTGSGSSTSGSTVLEWYNSGGVLMGSGETLDVTEAGSYTLIVTDPDNGCSAESLVVVTPDAEIPAIDIVPPLGLTCINDLSTLSASTDATGNIEIGWFDPAGDLITSNNEIEVNEGGIYTFMVTNLDNDCSAESSVLVADLVDIPVAVAEPLGELSCDETMVTLDGSFSSPFGTLEYEWIDPSGGMAGNESSLDAMEEGTYTLNITNSENGCTATVTVDVTSIVAEPEAVAVPDGIVNCNSDVVFLDGSGSSGGGDLTYAWFEGGTPLGSDETQEVAGAGTYTLIITDLANGCTAETPVVVEENLELPIPQIETPGLLDCVIETVTLDGSGSSGTGTIGLEWLDPSGAPLGSGNTVDVDAPGTYTLIVTNGSSGCTAEIQTTVGTNEELPAVATAVDGPITCDNQIVNLTGSGTAINGGSLSYQWLDSSGSPIGTDVEIPVSETGVYTFVVTNDDNGCTAEMPVTVTENILLPASNAGPIGLLTCDVTLVSLDGSASTSGNNISYEWTNTGGVVVGTTTSIQVDQTGTYTLLVTNTENGCTALSTTTVEPDAELPVANAGSGATLDCQIFSAVLDGSASSSGTDFSYEWLDPSGMQISTDLSIEVADPGTYTFIVNNDNNGCTATASVEVAEDNIPPFADPGLSPTLDCNTDMVTLNGSGSTGATAFVWTDADGNVISNNETVDVADIGTYQLEVMAANGCTDLATVIVDQDNELPIADPGLSGNLDCTTTQILIGGANTSQGVGITYEWTDDAGDIVATTATYEATSSGNYTLTVFNGNNNCESSASVMIDQDEGLPSSDAGPPAMINCNIIEVTLDGSGSSIGADISYQWLDQTGTPIGSGQTLDVDQTGTYTLLVSDGSNGCSAESQVVVTDDLALPTADAGQEQMLTCDIDMVSLNGSNSTVPSGQVTYEWVNPGGVTVGTEAIIDVSEAGIYQLLITGENGCTDMAEVTVALDANIPVADAGPGGNINCSVDMVTLGGTQTTTGNTISYEWVNAAGTVVATTPTFETTDAGIYTLTVFDTANDCNSTSSAEVAEFVEIPAVDPGPGGTLTCSLVEILLGGGSTSTGSDINYSWSDDDGNVIGTDVELSVVNPGTYTLTVNNSSNNCSDFASVTVGQSIGDPIADAGSSDTLTCETTSIMLSGSNSSIGSNIQYSWYDDQGVEIGNNMNMMVTSAGIYTLDVLDLDNGCLSTSQVEVIPDENLPSAAIASPEELTCIVEEVLLSGLGSSSVSGDLIYEWEDASSTMIANTEEITVNAPGIYTLHIIDPNNGCTDAVNVEVPQNINDPTADAGEADVLTCTVASVLLSGSGTGDDLSYEWFDENDVSIGNTSSLDVAAAGLYTLVVTDGSNGCEALSTVTVIPDDNLPVADANVAALLTCEIDLVEINGGGSSAGTNITYEWSNELGQPVGSTANIDVTTPGLYTLVVSDVSNSCSAQTTVLVEENEDPPNPDIIALGPAVIDCNNALVVLDAGSSTPFGNLEFQWSTTNGTILGSATASQIEAGEEGTYTLVVVNTLNGCVENTEFEVTINQADPMVNIAAPPVLTCNLVEFQLDGNGSSTNGNFSYNWTGNINSGQGTLTPDINTPGTYTLLVTNQDNGCTSEASITVTEDVEEPDAAAATGDDLDCITEVVSLSGNGSSQGNVFTYEWTGPSIVSGTTGLSPTVNGPGSYQLVVTNTQNGCTEIAITEVLENEAAPTAAAVLPEPPLCHGETGNLSVVSITGGTPPYTYSIDNGNTFYPDSSFVLFSGNYDVLIQDAIGCEFQQSIYIPDVVPVEVLANEPVVGIQLGADAQLLAVTNIPTWEIDTIMWTPTDSLSCTNCLDPYANPTETTTYEVTVVNENGCEDKAQIRLDLDKDRKVYIPNAFSPNGDGDNDLFMIYGAEIGIEKVNHFQIYNRWGEMVFQAEDFQPNDPAYGWGGMFRGELMNPAVFVFWAEVEFVDGYKKFFKGDVSLLK